MVDVEALSSSDPRVAAKGRGFFWLATCLCGGLLLLHAGWLVSALQLAGALCLGFAVFLYSSQSRMLYAPCPGSWAARAAAPLADGRPPAQTRASRARRRRTRTRITPRGTTPSSSRTCGYAPPTAWRCTGGG